MRTGYASSETTGPRPEEYLDAVKVLSDQFAGECATADAGARIRSTDWPTIGDLVDHLGQIQRWSARVVESGEATPREAFARPSTRERPEWMAESSAILVAALEDAGPDRPTWTLLGPGTAMFWFRRQAHEARKHLWDVRTAAVETPPLPAAGGMPLAADVLDELFGVFLARSRRKGLLTPLPAPLQLSATDAAVSWLITEDWEASRHETAYPAGEVDSAGEVDPAEHASAVGRDPVTLRAGLGDLVLFGWDRAIPEDLPDRFAIAGDRAPIAAYRDAPVHP